MAVCDLSGAHVAAGPMTQAELLAEIRRLYRALRALPGEWRSPARPDRRALEAEIFQLAAEYKAAAEPPPPIRRVA